MILIHTSSSLPEHLHNNPRQAKERPDEVEQSCDVHRQPPPAVLGGIARAPEQPSEKHDSKGGYKALSLVHLEGAESGRKRLKGNSHSPSLHFARKTGYNPNVVCNP